MHLGQAILRRQHKGLGQIVTGNDHAILLRLIEKFYGTLGIGGVVQIKNADNGRIPHRHIIADR